MKKNSLKQNLLYSEIKELTNNLHHKISYHILLADFNISYQHFLSFFYRKFHTYEFPEYFDKDNLDLLKELLEYYQREDLLQIFYKWGIFFKNEELLEWLDYYISIFISSLLNHKINKDSLEISLLGCDNPYDGFVFYCNNNISEELFFYKAAEIFLSHKKIKVNDLNLYRLEKYIEACFQKKILTYDFLYKDFFNQLYKEAVKYNFLTEEKRKKFKIKYDPSVQFYLDVLEITYIPENKEELKKIYYSLIKKYHPDTNPDGLEKTKLIIEAYTKLSKIYE